MATIAQAARTVGSNQSRSPQDRGFSRGLVENLDSYVVICFFVAAEKLHHLMVESDINHSSSAYLIQHDGFDLVLRRQYRTDWADIWPSAHESS